MAERGAGGGTPRGDRAEHDRRGFTLTRRRLLVGTSGLAILLLVPAACAPTASQSWADTTYWDDGTGWVD